MVYGVVVIIKNATLAELLYNMAGREDFRGFNNNCRTELQESYFVTKLLF